MAPSKSSTLAQWLTWLESLHPKEIDLGLTRVKSVAANIGLLDLPSTVITVAGTNGKGSYVKALSELLLNSEHSVGAFTSPHILKYNERIAINGSFASDEDICEAFIAIDRARGDISLSYFEFGTLAALYLFKKHEVDYAILEVGLGGRLDAVNIIDADLCVITTIDLDHQEWLGSNREVIGREKAGILRNARPFVCVDTDIPKSVLNASTEHACQSYYLGKEIQIESDDNESRIHCRTLSGESVAVTLRSHQLPIQSLAAAVQSYLLLGKEFDQGKLRSTLESAGLEGRFEKGVYAGQQLVLDVAHNPQAARHLALNLKQAFDTPVVAVFTCMRDKDLKEIVNPLGALVSDWVCVHIDGLARSRKAKETAHEISELGFSAEHASSCEAGLERALSIAAERKQPVLVVGSFFLIAEIKAYLEQR